MFHMVHLSDLHLSADVLSALPDKSPQRQILDNLGLALNKTKEDYDRDGDRWLVAITGDICDTATLASDHVKQILDLLWATLDGALKKPTVLLLPGNHDVRATGIIKCGKWWHKSKVIPALRAHIEASPNLQSRVSLYVNNGSPLVWRVPDGDLPVHLVAYDSTDLPYGLLSAGGMVRTEELLSLFPAVSATRKPIVVMLHHHLIPTPVADLSEVGSWLRYLLKRLASNADYEEVMQTALGAGSALSTLQSLDRPVLVLHGHKHYPSVRLLSATAAAAAGGSADVLILSAGAAGIAEKYRTGRMSPMQIWPSFNHLQIDEGRVQAHIVAYPDRMDQNVTRQLSRRTLTNMTYSGYSWRPVASTASTNAPPDTDPIPRLELNSSIVTIQSGVPPFADLRRSLHVERILDPGAHPRLASYDEGVDAAKDAVLEILPANVSAQGAAAKMLNAASREVRLCLDGTSTYTVNNALYVSSADFGVAYGLREAPFESVELVNRYYANTARLSVRGLLSQYGLERNDCFGSVTDLTLGIERPFQLRWDSGDATTIEVNDCLPRHRLRIYWPLKYSRKESTWHRLWRTIVLYFRRPQYLSRRQGSMKSKSALLVTALVGLVGFALLARSGAKASPAGGQGESLCTDQDGDGYGLGCAAGPDCNDRDPAIHPGAAETCNFKDDDCNGLVDDLANCPAPALDPSPVHVPAGSFLMGSEAGAADEKPVHRVDGSAFVMDRYEVTNARYRACVTVGTCAPPALASSNARTRYFDDPVFADYPVIHVSWKQAVQFCAFSGGRLPSEAEWERAAAGSAAPRTYPWGDSPPDCTKANFAGCVGDTDRVGRRVAGQSPYGAFDMAGNVWEWTADWYDAGYYAHSLGRDPAGPATGSLKVMRGGCWVSGASSLRTTCRKAELPDLWAPNVGFRCVYREVER